MAPRDADGEEPVGKVVLYSTVSVDGFIANERDQPGPLFDWLSAGDVPLDDAGQLKVSQVSADVTRAYWDEIGVTVVGRHVFDRRAASTTSSSCRTGQRPRDGTRTRRFASLTA
jgi:hypothetical protein